MAGYAPLYIRKPETGLVQSRQEFILPDDAFPTLENAFIWRERIKRKQGFRLLGQLRRLVVSVAIGLSGISPWSQNLFTLLSVTPTNTAQIELGSVVVTIGAITFTDNRLGDLVSVTPGNSGTINYATGAVVFTYTGPAAAVVVSFNYFPGLPAMGVREREIQGLNFEQTIVFDTKYAYRYALSGFEEFLPGTQWTGADDNFFWTTNYWVDSVQRKIFWATNFSGPLGDPIRYTNGINWADFAPQIDASGNVLAQCLCMVPFRGRMLVVNTYEGPNLAGSANFSNRIRWAAIGNPFTVVNAPTSIAVVNANAWRDDIVGQGGYLDIPTSQNIVAIGFVRDNLVVFCERSTWQLRYTGKSIAPFEIEKVNSELGTESTFSTIQFDTSLLGFGDKGIVACDSFKSYLIDKKIPDLAIFINNEQSSQVRIQGIRDFIQRVAFWTYVDQPENTPYEQKFPNRRLLYNYENDSWAVFTDSVTCLGNFQPQASLRWSDLGAPHIWASQNYEWNKRPAQIPLVAAGNQQGFVLQLDYQATNDQSLMLHNITGNNSDPQESAIFTSIDHNMATGQIIKLTSIPATTFGVGFNDRVYQVYVIDKDTFKLYAYDADTGHYTEALTIGVGVYEGGGVIFVRDNFRVVSKKFNFMDSGDNIQLGYLDILLNTTERSEIAINVYVDYNDSQPVNLQPQNNWSQSDISASLPDPFFNSVIPTSILDVNFGDATPYKGLDLSKVWKRVFCPCRGAFLTIEYTFNDFMMAAISQESDVQIDAQILWMRRAGKQLPIGR